MEYLKPAFQEYLNEEGEINIAGYTFDRDRILKDLEFDGYNTAFEEWLGTRKVENLSRAEEILNRSENKSRFRKLQQIYRTGAIVPFVGAGMSIPSGFPSWTSFLYSLLDETDFDREKFDQLIFNGAFETAAQRLVEKLPHGTFLERVENEFGEARSISGPVQRLPYLFKSGVITTNFDNVVKKCYQDCGCNFDEELLGPDAIEFPRSLGEGKKILVKLHGTSNSSGCRVFLESEYDLHYAKAAVLESVIEAISNRTLLFLGCSLSNDRTIKTLATIVQRRGVENMPRHYAFLQLKDEGERLARRDALAAANIFPIWYTEDHDECIEVLLEKLAE